MTPSHPPLPESKAHDASSFADAAARRRRFMSKRGEQIREDVLAALRRRRSPQSAYDVLRKLRELHPKIAPPTIYRALTDLIESGRVHRVESLKAYIACQCDDKEHASILSICDHCGSVEISTAEGLLEDLSSIVGRSGFSPVRHVIEVHGICTECGDGKSSAPGLNSQGHLL
ncbi:transcriptional repressor [Rhodobacteraceae bacterium NNCM2]|nr:transcriptional repressor [Coraliihabitans acroporae]